MGEVQDHPFFHPQLWTSGVLAPNMSSTTYIPSGFQCHSFPDLPPNWWCEEGQSPFLYGCSLGLCAQVDLDQEQRQRTPVAAQDALRRLWRSGILLLQMSANPSLFHPLPCCPLIKEFGKSLGLGFTVETKAQISDLIYPNVPLNSLKEGPCIPINVIGSDRLGFCGPPTLVVLSIFPVVLMHSQQRFTNRCPFCRLLSHPCADAAGPLHTFRL